MAVHIQLVDDLKSLLNYFADKLSWQIDLDSFDEIDDITYDFDAKEIGLQEDEFAKISSLRQLRPLVDDQPWGVFSIEFDSKRFEVTALRKVLSGLVPKRRNKDHAVWDKHDLLFLCFWGEDLNRTIGVAHFEDKVSGLPQIKMISCAPKCEGFEQISNFENNLSKLHWPEDTENFQEWKKNWSHAFTTQYHQTISETIELTDNLAVIAKAIRSRILSILKVETPNGYVHLLFEKFKQTLIHDMTEEQFADMYAQTVVYGLFSARCMDSDEHFDPKEAIDHIPNTNPFLKSLMKECFSQSNAKLSFDELQLNDIVELLDHTNMERILQDFNRQTGGGKEDPVIYFYEGFLNAYESEQKKRRGVYYTPQPVVNFIVRAVDDILKNEFGYSQGLADTSTKTISIKRDSKKKIDGLIRKVEDTVEVPAIQILDPATGTGTFLRQTIIQIWENFRTQHKGKSGEIIKRLWNEYVPAQLLPRLNGFELMMAPYAVAHMKLAMVLKETGYDFSGDERVKVFLTNSLEEPGTSSMQMIMENWEDPLATESIEANDVKKDQPINVVIGNPPYNVSSVNRNAWIQDLISIYKEGLGERKINLDDDYIKFIRYGQYIVEKSAQGVLAYISNNSFVNGVTHREMRRNLMNSFGTIYIINLHGDSNRREVCPDGSKDENVFDIQQGVSINIFIRDATKLSDCKVYYTDLYGLQTDKNALLRQTKLADIPWKEVSPSAPYFFFEDKDYSGNSKYNNGFSVAELFENKNTGIQTKNDDLTIQFEQKDIETIISDFISLPKSAIEERYGKKDGTWTIENAQNDLLLKEFNIVPILFRPFDIRYTALTAKSNGFLGRPRYSTMCHMIRSNNIALLVGRQNKSNTIDSFLVTNFVSEMKCAERTIQSYHLPLFLYEQTVNGIKCRPNFDLDIIYNIRNSLHLNMAPKRVFKGEDCFTPLDLFDYIYAVLHSPSYRKTYQEFLKIDFPRVPYPTNQEIFWKLVKLGSELRELHLMESPKLEILITDFPVSGSNEAEKITYNDSNVYINQTQYFRGVPQIAWEFYIGGYQPAQKWLKDRKGRVLSGEDILHYQKIIAVLTETDRIMKEIDNVIEF